MTEEEIIQKIQDVLQMLSIEEKILDQGVYSPSMELRVEILIEKGRLLTALLEGKRREPRWVL